MSKAKAKLLKIKILGLFIIGLMSTMGVAGSSTIVAETHTRTGAWAASGSMTMIVKVYFTDSGGSFNIYKVKVTMSWEYDIGAYGDCYGPSFRAASVYIEDEYGNAEVDIQIGQWADGQTTYFQNVNGLPMNSMNKFTVRASATADMELVTWGGDCVERDLNPTPYGVYYHRGE